jgi:hypothetical protein
VKVYIAGPITDFVGHREAFDRAKAVVAALGYEPVSPLDLYPGDDWREAMLADVPVLIQSDAILLLPGWPQSRGARGELQLALLLGLRVLSLVGDDVWDVTEPAQRSRGGGLLGGFPAEVSR